LIEVITRLGYQELRQSSAVAARRAMLQVLKAHKGNVSKTARIMNVTRATVYKALKKKESGDLNDRSRAPKRVHNKTDVEIESRILKARDQTGYGAVRIKEKLEDVDKIVLSAHTIRNILRRNKTKGKKHRPRNKTERQFVDWYSTKAFEVVQIDLKYIADRGEEFGGKSWLKIVERKKLLSDFGCTFIQNRAGHPEENPHVERSHRTDDDEFYIPRILSIDSPKNFFFEAMNFLYYYNAVRRHSSLGRQPPFAHLSKTAIGLDDRIKYVPPIFLDHLAAKLGDWSGYHLLASHHFP